MEHGGYNVFVRTWWRRGPDGGLVPGAGKRRHIARGVSEERALELCRAYNDTHSPGPLSRKAEYESA